VPQHSTLTELGIRAVKRPSRGTITLWDGSQKHFGLRISQGGTKSFIVLFGSGRRQSIGRYPTISLAEARAEAKRLLAEHTLGRHRPGAVRFDQATAEYFVDLEQRVQQGINRPRTLACYRRFINRYFKFRRTLLSDITHEDITRRLPKAPAERNHALAAIKIFFSWAQKPPRRYVPHNPCEGMTIAKRPSRSRTLTKAELATILRTALEGTDCISRIVALLICTGQRRGEITALQWSWINTNDGTIRLPDSITKNKSEHTFPFGELAAGIIANIAPEEKGDHLFPASRAHVDGKPTTIFNGFQTTKPEFDQRCGISNWTLHDVRRTFATGLAELGTLPHIIERLLNHKFGSISNRADAIVSAVAEVYNRATYMPEMRNAVAKWETHLNSLLSPADAISKDRAA
jgi:integrase